jgi:hypothetical protein
VRTKSERGALLLDQLETSRGYSQARLEGISDEEYLWEPAPGGWSIRRRAEATTADCYGAGEWVLDFVRGDPKPAPVTTIAWRLGHLYSGFSLRWDWTFGGKQLSRDSLEFSPSAAEAQERYWDLMDRWRDSVAALSDEELDTVGLSQYPGGLDPKLPFISIVWWTNREFIQHTGEIALLRDLWVARSQQVSL